MEMWMKEYQMRQTTYFLLLVVDAVRGMNVLKEMWINDHY